jgi:serine/threonine-protein kinase
VVPFGHRSIGKFVHGGKLRARVIARIAEVTKIASNARMTLPSGSVFAERFQILSVIGRGGMGTVYRARHLGLAKDVALKILDGTDHDQRFAREARAIARLDHPSCVRVLDCGRDEEDWRPYIAMDLLEGPTLLELLRRGGRLSPQRAVDITSDLLAGLDHAHAHGVLHRDLKPANVIVTSTRAVLIDFGLAHLIDEAALTARGMCVGSPSYLAPERLDGLRYDARADVYGAGVLLYEMLAGMKPFVGATPLEILEQCRDRPARPLRTYRDDIPRSLEAAITCAMAKDPSRRFSSAAAMREAIELPSLDAGSTMELTVADLLV